MIILSCHLRIIYKMLRERQNWEFFKKIEYIFKLEEYRTKKNIEKYLGNVFMSGKVMPRPRLKGRYVFLLKTVKGRKVIQHTLVTCPRTPQPNQKEIGTDLTTTDQISCLTKVGLIYHHAVGTAWRPESLPLPNYGPIEIEWVWISSSERITSV